MTPKTPLTVAQARHLIPGYAARMRETVTVADADDVGIKVTLQGFMKELKKTRRRQRCRADELDMLEALGFADDLKENHHSRFLAYLLGPNETHAQENLFFRALRAFVWVV